MAIILSLSACSSVEEHLETNNNTIDDVFTFDIPQSLMYMTVANFLSMDEVDQDFYMLKGDNNNLLGEQNPQIIEQYFRNKLSVSQPQQNEIRNILYTIQNTPEGEEMFNKIFSKFDKIIIGFDEHEKGGIAIITEVEGGEIHNFISLGKIDSGYYCDNIKGKEVQKNTLTRIVFHELYHFANHLIPNKIDSNVNLSEEDETVRATDAFMEEYFNMCQRINYSNILVLN